VLSFFTRDVVYQKLSKLVDCSRSYSKIKGAKGGVFETLYIIGTQAEGSELCSELTKTSLCYVVCPGKKKQISGFYLICPCVSLLLKRANDYDYTLMLRAYKMLDSVKCVSGWGSVLPHHTGSLKQNDRIRCKGKAIF